MCEYFVIMVVSMSIKMCNFLSSVFLCLVLFTYSADSIRVLSSGYNYAHYFDVKELAKVQGKLYTLLLYVKGKSDAHFYFTSQSNAKTEDGFEIVIGGWDNSKSAIREKKQGEHATELSKEGLLSTKEHRGFWLRFEADGNRLAIGEEGTTEPLMSYTGQKRMPMKFLSVATWGDLVLDWIVKPTGTSEKDFNNKDKTNVVKRQFSNFTMTQRCVVSFNYL